MELQFEDLLAIERDQLYSWNRVLFAEALTIVLALLLSVGAVELKIGPFSTADVLVNPLVAFVVGALSGISERALPSRVSAQASKLRAGDSAAGGR